MKNARKAVFAMKVSSVAASLAVALGAQAGTLVMNTNQSDPNAKSSFQALVDGFKKANPDVEVKVNTIDHEAYKEQLPNFLTAEAPDIVTWFAGERMNYYASRGLLDDISDLWKKEKLYDSMASSVSLSTYKGKQYAVPTSYYNWGVYYRKDLFAKAGVTAPPKTWAEFKDACAKLKAAGVTPITIGIKHPWPAAAWFDYLDLRVNGYDFHMKLMAGEVAYTDPRMKKVFTTWKELVDPGYFLENAATFDFQEAQPFLFDGRAAMYLMGNFITNNYPKDIVDKMGYFQFPVIDPKVPNAEEGPTDTLHIPARAKNKVDARRFLAYVARPDVIGANANNNKVLSPNRYSPAPTDPGLKQGFEVLSNAKGVTQFYDRDCTKEMADEGMKAMQEFMIHPDRLDAVLTRLEATRKRIYKVK